MKGKRIVQVWAVLALLVSLGIGVGGASSAMDELGPEATAGTAFTYQGQLRDGSGPVNATCDLQFRLWDASVGGVQVGYTWLLEDVVLADGLFTARLDFGAEAFRGQARYLEVAASCPAGQPYVPLPRQELTGSPYALWALGAAWAGLEGVPADLADGDQDTLYSAGTGLTLNSGQFSVNLAGSGTAVTASRSDHNHDAAYVNEGQASSVSTGMVQNSTLLLEDLNQSGCSTGQVIKWNGGAWACAADQTATGSYWSLSGNASTTPATNYLGTSDNAALELKVNGQRALRLEPASSPNLLGGYSGNQLTAGVIGATVSGGGSSGNANRVTDSWGTVSGGTNNRAGDDVGTVDDARFATVGGGYGNMAGKDSATVAGGYFNSVIGVYGTVGGGEQNHANGGRSTVGGGSSNEAIGPYATVGGGWSNAANVQYTTVGGGYDNTASNEYTTVGGGSTNTASQLDATVAGGSHNTASGARAAVGGGYGNTASGQNATVGGGENNTASVNDATVGGGRWNTAAAGFATIGGGGPTDLDNPQTTSNRVTDMYGTVGGGGNNQAGNGDEDPNNGVYATVGGGYDNTAYGEGATVGGGYDNTAQGIYATVGGGHDNTAWGMNATVGGGEANIAGDDIATISGGLNNWARGHGSMVPGGTGNRAVGNYSFTAGYFAQALNDGCFVWGDYSSGTLTCDVNNRWMARASGGVYFYTNSALSSGVYISAGGNSWNGISDRAVKENLSPADGQALLETLASLPVQEYNLKSQDPAIRHIGLVAQDFAAFGYGESDLAINMQDADGVALAAIQGLYAENQALKAENVAQQTQIDNLEARLAALEAGRGAGAPSARLPGGWLLLGGGVAAVGVVVGRRAWGGGR